jgi:acyl-coenzyme A synthetase/AMP-(fatty) acid ligase
MEMMKMTVGGLLEEGAQMVPDKIAIVDGPRRITYRELNMAADSLAASLWDLGFVKGDRVAIYMPNSLELMTAFYAFQKLGVVVAWINPNYRSHEAEFVIRNSQAKGVVIFREWEEYDYLKALSALPEGETHLESIIVVGNGTGDRVHGFQDLVKRGADREYPRPTLEPQKDLSMLLYTSGTTGRPKGAMISHSAAVKAGWAYSLGVGAKSDDIFIGFLPMSHSYGCGAILIQPILLQSTVALMDKFDTERAFEIIQTERITIQLGSPAHYILELNHPSRMNYDLSSLRAGLIAGQIAPEGLITRVDAEMGVYISSFWGASEVGPGLGFICSYPSPLEIREKYIGKPVEGTMARVVNPVTRQPLPDGERGELTLRGWHVMKGYWKNPEETRNQIVDGWLFMGDLMSREKDGYFKIYGRTKDLINRGGFKIYPYELESLIIQHPKVEQACVVATPNPVLGESICACIIASPGEKVTLKEIREFLKGKIAAHKLPDELCLMEDFPRLSGGVKIKKFGQGGLAELAEKDDKREQVRR